MKRIHFSFLAPLLFCALAPTAAMAQPQVPIVLTQRLDHPVSNIKVLGMHDVSIIPDTADYVAVVTQGTADQIDSLRMPMEHIRFSSGGLTIPESFPYRNGISLHTTAKRLQVETADDSRAWLVGGGDTLRFEFLRLEARGHSTIMAIHPVVADQAVIRGADFATIRYRHVSSPDLDIWSASESRVQRMDSVGQENAFRYTIPPSLHCLFGGYAFGVSGWSAAPFGGMAVPMDDYVGSISLGQMDIRFGWNFFRRRYWDFGIGFASHIEIFSFSNLLMGTTVDPVSGLTHLGPVAEPDYYRYHGSDGQGRVWRSNMGVVYLQFPLRVEWHRRLDYKGVRVSAELRPGFVLSKKSILLFKECAWSSGKRIDLITDSIGSLVNRFHCDLRIDIGWSNVSFFVQGALTPLFRTARKDDLPALDTKVYPLTMGFSFNI